MAKKRKTPVAKRPLTKQQLSKWQRQQQMQRIMTIVGVVFLAFILIYVGYGYYSDRVKPFHQPVVKVNDRLFDMDYYLKVLDVYSSGQSSELVPQWADVAMQAIEASELTRQGAVELGISVSDDEVKSEMERAKLPDDKVFRDATVTRLLGDKLLKDYFNPRLPITDEQVKVQAMFLEDKKTAREVADKLAAGDNFTFLAGSYSVETMTKGRSGDLGWVLKDFASTFLGDSLLKDIAFSLEPGVLSEPTYDDSITKNFGYWIIQVLERDENKGSHARGILLGSREEAEEVKTKLAGGEDFTTLAIKYSQYSETKDNGGDFGWLQVEDESKNKTVVRAAFALDPNTVSGAIRDDAVKTRGGYWLVRVLDKDSNRQIDPETRAGLNRDAYDKWLTEIKDKSVIEEYLDEAKKSWAVNQILKRAGGTISGS